MKRALYFILFYVISIHVFSQDIADLERNPSFKGITIGAPISRYSDILTFSHTSQAGNVYRVNQSSYLSIFNIKMQEMLVVEKEGKVYTIFLKKTYPSDKSGVNVFNANELLSLYSNLRSKYGNNSFSLDDMSGTPSVCGMRWKAYSVVLDIVYLFYGTSSDGDSRLSYMLYQREDDY